MTLDQPEREGRKRRGGLFVNDTEICERLNIPEREGLRVIRSLDADRQSGFPPKIAAFGDRRYWPAVQDYLDTVYGLQAPQARLVSSRPINPQARKTA